MALRLLQIPGARSRITRLRTDGEGIHQTRGRKDDEPISAMNAFLDAAFRGQLPQAGILPGLILLLVFGILALGSRMISRPD